jgi:hypothetical protein
VDLVDSELFLRGGWPYLYQERGADPVQFLNDFISTFISKDIALLSGVQNLGTFEKLLQLLAARTGQLLNLSELATQVGIQVSTVSQWISLLEHNHLVLQIPAYSTNLSKRLIKAPKFHFLDVGLATRLQGWRQVEPLIVSPAIGGIFESLVCSELIKARDHAGVPLELFHLRTKEKEEIDFLVRLEQPSGIAWIAIEAKFAAQAARGEPLPALLEKESLSIQRWVVTFDGEKRQLQHNTMQVPIAMLLGELTAEVGRC